MHISLYFIKITTSFYAIELSFFVCYKKCVNSSYLAFLKKLRVSLFIDYMLVSHNKPMTDVQYYYSKFFLI